MRRYWKKGVSSELMNPYKGEKTTQEWKIKWGVFRGLTAMGVKAGIWIPPPVFYGYDLLCPAILADQILNRFHHR